MERKKLQDIIRRAIPPTCSAFMSNACSTLTVYFWDKHLPQLSPLLSF